MGESMDEQTEHRHHDEHEALKAEIARLRERIREMSAGGEHESGTGEGGAGPLEEFLHRFGTSREQGEKVVKELAEEVERHPLVSIMAAFGLGYVVAKLFYHRGRK